MIESAEKVDVWADGTPNGFGAECVCPSQTQWLMYRDEHPPAPYCTCPYGGQIDMVFGDDGSCDCPDDATKLPTQSAYPSTGLNGLGVTNKNNQNKNFHCIYLKDCQQAYDLKLIKQGSGNSQITVRAPSGQNRMVNAFCVTEYLRETTRKTRTHTTISCNALMGLAEASYKCRHVNYATSYDTCKEHGYVRAPFRSRNHYMQVNRHMGYQKFHRYHFLTIHGVYSWRYWSYSNRYWWHRGRQGYPMKSYGTGNRGGYGSWWRSIDNGPWWMTNNHNNGEPNGDYYANANLRTSWGYIQTWGYSHFNDHRNYGWTGGDYTCGHSYY
jgi:hypothetical protein